MDDEELDRDVVGEQEQEVAYAGEGQEPKSGLLLPAHPHLVDAPLDQRLTLVVAEVPYRRPQGPDATPEEGLVDGVLEPGAVPQGQPGDRAGIAPEAQRHQYRLEEGIEDHEREEGERQDPERSHLWPPGFDLAH